MYIHIIIYNMLGYPKARSVIQRAITRKNNEQQNITLFAIYSSGAAQSRSITLAGKVVSFLFITFYMATGTYYWYLYLFEIFVNATLPRLSTHTHTNTNTNIEIANSTFTSIDCFVPVQRWLDIGRKGEGRRAGLGIGCYAFYFSWFLVLLFVYYYYFSTYIIYKWTLYTFSMVYATYE